MNRFQTSTVSSISYSSHHQLNSFRNENNQAQVSPLMKSFEMPSTPSNYLQNFPRDFYPSKTISELYKQLYHLPGLSSTKYIVQKENKHKHHHHKDKSSSWLFNLNPFDCESEYSDEDDYGD